jgi:Bacterial PH domain
MTPPAPYRIVVPQPPFRSPMTLDATNRVLTVVLSFVILGFVLLTSVGVGRLAGPVPALVIAPLVVVMLLACAMSPRAVSVVAGDLMIERRAWPALRVPLASIQHAEAFECGGRMLRLFGVGGFFGSYGLFSSAVLGRFRLYATRRGKAVLVRRRDGALPLLFTPDDVGGTVAAIDPRHDEAATAGGLS